jgi:hypothetical protein
MVQHTFLTASTHELIDMSKEDVIQDQVSKVEVPENRSPSPSPEVALTEFKLHTREKVVFTLLMILSFFAALESTGIGVALPVLKRPFVPNRQHNI